MSLESDRWRAAVWRHDAGDGGHGDGGHGDGGHGDRLPEWTDRWRLSCFRGSKASAAPLCRPPSPPGSPSAAGRWPPAAPVAPWDVNTHTHTVNSLASRIVFIVDPRSGVFR